MVSPGIEHAQGDESALLLMVINCHHNPPPPLNDVSYFMHVTTLLTRDPRQS